MCHPVESCTLPNVTSTDLLVCGHGLVSPELEELRCEEELVGLGLLGDAVVLGVRLGLLLVQVDLVVDAVKGVRSAHVYPGWQLNRFFLVAQICAWVPKFWLGHGHQNIYYRHKTPIY